MDMKQMAYSMGRADYAEGKPMSANRFRANNVYYEEWQRGWVDATLSDPLLDGDEKQNLIGAQ